MTLEELLKKHGLTDEQIGQVKTGMKENKLFITSEENMDVRYPKLKADYDALVTKDGESTKLIEELKKGTSGNQELQKKVTTYETKVSELETELQNTKIESAIKVALLGAKATDVDYLSYKLKEKNSEIKLDDQGNIKGIDDIISGLKTQFPTQFETTASKKFEEKKLPENDDQNKISKEDFNKMGYQERLKLYNENPEAYNELSGNKD